MTKRSRKLHKAAVQGSASQPTDTAAVPETPPRDTGNPDAMNTADDQNSDVAQDSDSARPPFPFRSIALSDTAHGPKMRLLRSNKFQQMQMQFDEKPDEKYRQMLIQQGWKWRIEEKVWSKQLDQENRWRVQADAERLFNEIGSAIRADKGLSAILEFGG